MKKEIRSLVILLGVCLGLAFITGGLEGGVQMVKIYLILVPLIIIVRLFIIWMLSVIAKRSSRP